VTADDSGQPPPDSVIEAHGLGARENPV